MKSRIIVIIFFMVFALNYANAQNKNFGFGFVLGDPTGFSFKFGLGGNNAISAVLGGSSFGTPRIGADYLWYYNSFNSSIVELYFGPGAALGFGHSHEWYWHDDNKYYEHNDLSLGARMIIGINVVPPRTPLEIYLELGPMIEVVPDFHSDVEVGLGVRFFP